MKRLRGSALPAAVAAATLALCGAGYARAATITVGSPLTASFSSRIFCSPLCTAANLKLPEPGARATSPVSGAIVRWRVLDAAGAAFSLRVLHPTGSTYEGAGTSSPQTPTGLGVETFATDLPIKAGDLIGIEANGTAAELGFANDPAANRIVWFTPVGEGTTPTVPGLEVEQEMAYDADVLPAPTITSLTPSSGSSGGDTAVTIGGDNFAELKGVSFGSNPAASYTVDSESQITATSPAGTAGPVPVTVTTVAGSATAAQEFTYAAPPTTTPTAAPTCKVPKLGGKKLQAAKKAIRAAHCRPGRVTRKKGVTARTGKIARQRPKAGTERRAGSRVALKLG